MRRTRALPLVLDVLDDGLEIYRRNFGSFVLIAALILIPLWLGGNALLGMRSHSRLVNTLLIATTILLAVGLIVYLIGSLSRAASTALTHNRVEIRAALTIQPSRLARSMWYAALRTARALLYYTVGGLSWAILIGIALFLVGSFTTLSIQWWGLGSSVSSVIGSFLSLLGAYFLLVLVLGMPLTNMIYALQPWFLEKRPAREIRQRLAELWNTDFDEDGMYFAAVLAVSTIGIILGLSLGVIAWLLPPPIAQFEATASDIFRIAGTLVVVVVVVPPLPIWMALLYRHAAALRDGNEFAQEIAAWQAQHGSFSTTQPTFNMNNTELS